MKCSVVARETYRTQNSFGFYDLIFFQNEDGLIRVRIHAMPSYGDRVQDPATTFRIQDEQGHYWIEFLDPDTLDTIEKTKAAVARWCEWTQTYIEQGTRFNTNT